MRAAFAIALAAIALPACVEPVAIPRHDIALFCEVEACDPEAVAVAVERFAAEWTRRFNDAPVLPKTLTVREHVWGGIDWEHNGSRTVGYTNGDDVVVVGVDLDDGRAIPIDDTALFHEMTHATFKATVGDGDLDHVGGAGAWTAEHDKMLDVLARDGDFIVTR